MLYCVQYTLISSARFLTGAPTDMSQTDGVASFETTDHSTIGGIRGLKRSKQVTQYLGVQYATLKDRFARAELVETYRQGGVLDATTFG